MRNILLFITVATASFIESKNYRYYICERIGEGQDAEVHSAIMLPKNNPIVGDPCKDNPTKIALRCEFPMKYLHQVSRQLPFMKVLEQADWAPQGFETFTRIDGKHAGKKCTSMSLLGQNIREIRESRSDPFPLPTLLTIGMQMITILDELHNVHEIVHCDVHSKNWVTRIDNSDKLSLVDYGYMKLKTNPRVPFDRVLSELKEMVITLRFLVDLDNNFYVAKKIKNFDMNLVCPKDVIPTEIKNLVEFVYSLKPEQVTVDTYRQMFDLMKSMLPIGFEYKERIEWNPIQLSETVESNISTDNLELILTEMVQVDESTTLADTPPEKNESITNKVPEIFELIQPVQTSDGIESNPSIGRPEDSEQNASGAALSDVIESIHSVRIPDNYDTTKVEDNSVEPTPEDELDEGKKVSVSI